MRRTLLKACTAIMSLSETVSMAQKTGRGAFILFEGVDRCGKSTQAAMLANHFPHGELIRFPDRTSVIGHLINSYLTSASEMSDETIHLLFSANRWEAAAGLEKRLAAGTTLICDRYAYSGVAFSSAKGMDMSWCKNCDVGLPAPDVVIFLDITPEKASERGQYGEERYEKLHFQVKVREKFESLKLADTEVPWHVLDATKSIEQLHEEIKAIAENTIADVKDKSVGRLWMKK